MVGDPEVDEVRGILGIVLHQQAVGREGLEDAVAEGVAELGIGHPAVKSERGDQHDIVDAGVRREIEDRFDHPLAHVGGAHGRQGERDVVERDRQPHAREKQRAQRLGVTEGIVEGMSDRLVGIGERSKGLGPVDDPRPDGKPLEPEALAVPNQGRRSRSVDFEDEAGPRAHIASLVVSAAFGLPALVLGASGPDPPLRMSNTIFTAPRRPAAAACATASS